MTDNTKETNIEQEGTPVCEKCGNLLIWEPLDVGLGDAGEKSDASTEGEWVCPHCQGEIDFLGEEDE